LYQSPEGLYNVGIINGWGKWVVRPFHHNRINSQAKESQMKIRFTAAMLLMTILLTSCGGKGVYGKVTDNDAKKPISGASVELKCTDCAAHFTANTDENGAYSFPDAPAGNYTLSIVWYTPPACPGITPFQTLGTFGDFVVTFAGYGGLGGTGNKRVIAVGEFKLGSGKKMDLKIACPK
jgi:hypothetical protein